MSNVSKFTSKDDIHEEACLWVSRIDRGLTSEETDTLRDWLNASQSHRRILFDVARVWDDLSVLNELKGMFPLRPQIKGETGIYFLGGSCRTFVSNHRMTSVCLVFNDHLPVAIVHIA